MVPVKIVTLHLSTYKGEMSAEVLEEVIRLSSKYHLRERFRTEAHNIMILPSMFHLVALDLSKYYGSITALEYRTLRQIAACGVEVTPLNLFYFDVVDDTAAASILFLQQMMAVRGASSSSAVRAIKPSHEITLDEYAFRRTLDDVFSALLASASATVVAVSTEHQRTDHDQSTELHVVQLASQSSGTWQDWINRG